MSYLQFPRLHFSGTFQSDIPTVNNPRDYYDNDEFQTSYQLPAYPIGNGGPSPNGTGSWRLYNCTVQRVTYLDGTICDDARLDPIIGMPLSGVDSRVDGKMVDLDTDEKTTELWGFQILVGNGENAVFQGEYEVAAFSDYWFRAQDATFGDLGGSAFYQSVLNIGRWNNAIRSRFLDELAAGSPSGQAPEKLSIKFNLDAFDFNPASVNFLFGRITGTIGKYLPEEPWHFVNSRTLFPNPAARIGLNTAYCKVDNGIVHVDLGNSLPMEKGVTANVDQIYLAVLPATGAPVLLGEINYAAPDWYTATAGVVSIPFTQDKAAIIENNPLAIFHTASGRILLQENEGGIFVNADAFTFRFNPGEKQTVRLYASALGKPLPNQVIRLFNIPGRRTRPGAPSAISFPDTVTTNAAGVAEIPVTASDPGTPRGFIDGQMYYIGYSLGNIRSSNTVMIKVYSGYKVPDQPTWMEHVQPIFQQYANLYPVMKAIVDLSNYASVMQRLHVLKNVFRLPISSPNYMPVTRDLSAAKLEMLRKWLDNPVYMKLDDVGQLKQALQTALELEHATIPPYLCALYSIKQGHNIEVAELIRGVVMEEMLHMALVSNLLIAIGGSPDMVHPGFVPRYPASLPGGLRAGLTVHLRRCSIEHIRDTFMTIEEPEEVVQTKMKALHQQWPEGTNPYTIGWFYDEIKRGLTELSNAGKIIFGNEDKQVKEWNGQGKLFVIKNLQDALNALEQIKDQGEGMSASDPQDGDGELAHYYKFAEIVNGHHLERKKDGTFSYTGAKIPFDPKGVWPMEDDPQPVNYPEKSRAQILSVQFAQAYQAMLKGLHRTFNGEPGYLQEAVGTMFALSLMARKLVETPTGASDGTTMAPAFQLP